jgi:hypothetical protein
MTETAEIHQDVIMRSNEYYKYSNPFALQMYFHYMKKKDILDLLAMPNENWLPKKYPEDITQFHLVADCMLKYYYDRFAKTEEVVWEDIDGNIDTNPDEEFKREHEYWKKISEEKKEPEYPYLEYEDKEEVTAFNSRQRIFSRDFLEKKF